MSIMPPPTHGPKISFSTFAVARWCTQTVVITDPKAIRDPLSDALAALASQVQQLEDTVKQLARERDEAEQALRNIARS